MSELINDPLVRFALWVTLSIIFLVTAVTTCAAVLSVRHQARLRHAMRLVAHWRPLLLDSIDTVPLQVPPVRDRDWHTLLQLWISFHDSVRGPARHRLKAIALRTRMDLAARRLLLRGATNARILAVEALGSLGDKESWSMIERLADSDHSTLSLSASRALIMIDGEQGIAIVTPKLASREDWPIGRTRTMLAEAGPEMASKALITAIDTAPAAQLPRLIALMDCAHGQDASPILKRLLATSDDYEILVACLKSRHVPGDRELLMGLARHSSWQVRTQAARVFGEVAQPGDQTLFISLLADPVWWVRYRAGQALANLAFVSRNELWRIRSSLTDKFAQNILDQVVAEGCRQ